MLDDWPRRIRLWSKKVTLLQQFVIYTVIVLGLAMTALGTWMSARIADGVLRTNAAAATLFFFEPHVQSIHDGGTLSSDDLANLEKISNDFALRRHIESIKVWRPDGTILFSQRKDLIGKKFSNVPIQSALNGGIGVAAAKLDDEDNEIERA